MRDLPTRSLDPITDERVTLYAEAVGDHNPVHFDEAFARAAGLPTTVVHGPLTTALVIDALVSAFGQPALRNFDVRLRAPVFRGDALTVRKTDYGVEVRNQSDQVVGTAVVVLEGDE